MRLNFALVFGLCALPALAGEDTRPAAPLPGSPDWFAGIWAVGTAEIDGFENILGQSPDCADRVVTITLQDSPIIVFSSSSSGQITSTRFEVRPAFRGNHPWWPVDDPAGANLVSKPVSENSFQLADVDPSNGRARWQSATQFWRCPTTD